MQFSCVNVSFVTEDIDGSRSQLTKIFVLHGKILVYLALETKNEFILYSTRRTRSQRFDSSIRDPE